MSAHRTLSLASVLVSLVPLAAFAACNGEFRFDDAPPLDGGNEEGGEPGTDAASTACKSDGDCLSLGLKCDVPSGRCVACLDDAQCTSGARRHCERSLHVCVECLATADCPTRHTCEPITHRCIDACAEGDEYCPLAGFVCDEYARRCIECKTNAHCAGSQRGPTCDTAIGMCVECAGNAACPTTKPHCDRRTGKCVGCVTSAECPAGSACDPSSETCRSLGQ